MVKLAKKLAILKGILTNVCQRVWDGQALQRAAALHAKLSDIHWVECLSLKSKLPNVGH